MVEIREEDGSNSTGSQSFRSTAGMRHGGGGGMMKYLMDGGINSVLWLLRGATIVCGLMFIFPLGLNKYSAYQKTLLSGAATNALRLHQRVGRVRFDMNFLQTILAEDSFHYLIYSISLLTVYPTTLGIATVMLFAFLHWCNFFVQLMQVNNFGHTVLCQTIDSFMRLRTQFILHLAACCEIFLFAVIVCFVFVGKANIFVAVIYYRFLWVRCASRRNPHTRMAFHDFRLFVENIARHRICPGLLKNAIFWTTEKIGSLAPAYTAP